MKKIYLVPTIEVVEYQAEDEMLEVSVESDDYGIGFNGTDDEGKSEVYARSMLIMVLFDE